MTVLRRLATRAGMNPRGLVTACSVLLCYLLIQAHQVVTEGDAWPFSSYPMYSWMQGPTASKSALVGVGKDGEFELTSEYTRPLSGARLRWVAGSVGTKRGNRAFGAFLRRYAERRAAGNADWPELHALRQYRSTWKIRPNLAGIDRPSRKLTSATLALDPGRKRALEESIGADGKSQPARPVANGDVVLRVSDAEVRGKARLVRDKSASTGRAVRLPHGKSKKKASKRPRDAARFEFRAKPGKYWVWLRGTSAKGTKHDSVWLQFDDQIGTKRTSFKEGAGNFRSGYPAKAYAWSSAHPAVKPIAVKLKGNKHRLEISGREGPVQIDQILLSKVWSENPLYDGPVTQKASGHE